MKRKIVKVSVKTCAFQVNHNSAVPCSQSFKTLEIFTHSNVWNAKDTSKPLPTRISLMDSGTYLWLPLLPQSLRKQKNMVFSHYDASCIQLIEDWCFMHFFFIYIYNTQSRAMQRSLGGWVLKVEKGNMDQDSKIPACKNYNITCWIMAMFEQNITNQTMLYD